MPGRSECNHCPLKDNPDVDCIVLSTNHLPFCNGVTHGHQFYRDGMAQRVLEMSTPQTPGGFQDNTETRGCGNSLVEDTELIEAYNQPNKYVEAMRNLPSMIKSATGAAVRFVGNGGKFVSEATQEERLAICNQCDQYDNVHNKCKVCKCHMPTKTRLPLESCPLNKWTVSV